VYAPTGKANACLAGDVDPAPLLTHVLGEHRARQVHDQPDPVAFHHRLPRDIDALWTGHRHDDCRERACGQDARREK
jgi:hypothetical protein